MFISGHTGNEMRPANREHTEKAPFVHNRPNPNGSVLSLREIHEVLHGRLRVDTIPSCIDQLPFIPMVAGN